MRSRGSASRALLWAIALDALVIGFVFLTWQSCAEAQEPSSPRSELVVRDGVTGMWFPMDTARRMLADLQELPVRQRMVTLLEEELELRDTQVLRLREVATLELEAARVASDALEAAVRQTREARQELDAWYRSPVLWAVVGVVVAGLVVWASVEVLRATAGP